MCVHGVCVCVFTAVCVCTLDGLNAEHKFRVCHCGEGGVGRRNALRGERVRRRAGKQLASEWWLTPVSDSSDCRRELKSVPPAARRETSGSEQMLTQSERAKGEEERESHEEESRVYVLVKVLLCVIKHPFWLVTPDFLVLPSLIPEPCYTGAETRDEEAGTPSCNPPSLPHLRS